MMPTTVPPPADPPGTSKTQSMLIVGCTVGVAYLLYQLGDMFQRIQSFEIYTTPPGIGEICKLLATVVVIVAFALGIDVRKMISTVLGGTKE